MAPDDSGLALMQEFGLPLPDSDPRSKDGC
jgi:hypothetical protein